jgi:DNA-binding PadR family transcriptional regulator
MSRSHNPRQAESLEEGLRRVLAIAPASGYAMTQPLRAARQAADPDIVRSTYLSLHRLERQGLLTSEWQAVPGRPMAAKCYRVTPRGITDWDHHRHVRPFWSFIR